MASVAAALAPGDFGRESHRAIFATLSRIDASGDAVDLVSLKGELERQGQLESVGGAKYLGALVDSIPKLTDGSTAVAGWAKRIKERARFRRTLAGMRRLQDRAESDDI